MDVVNNVLLSMKVIIAYNNKTRDKLFFVCLKCCFVIKPTGSAPAHEKLKHFYEQF